MQAKAAERDDARGKSDCRFCSANAQHASDRDGPSTGADVDTVSC